MSTPQQITQGDSMPTSLYQLEAAIVELFALRDEAEYEADSQALAVIDQEIQKWVAAELRKVDGVVSFIRETDARADIAEAEAKRLTDRAKVWRAKGQRVKDAALQAMQDHGITKPLHGNSSTLRIQKNGGLQKIETDMAILGIDYRTFRITLPGFMHERLMALLPEEWKVGLVNMTANDPDLDLIRAALKQRVKCPECDRGRISAAEKVSLQYAEVNFTDCPRCEGSGTIPNSVPGARLVPRGEHLRIS